MDDLNILPEVTKIKEEIIKNRRHLHSIPEVAFEEVETAKYIVQELRSYGITEIYEKIGKTGVVAIIKGGKDERSVKKRKVDEKEKKVYPCILLRADMDGLPIQETADVLYASKNKGVMHACGHDGHMSGLLAAAKILNAQKEELQGSIKLIFQPAEEGRGGAPAMIKDGVLEGGKCGPEVDYVYGLHLWSYEKLGDICCSAGPVMAASDRFSIDVKGKGGHGAAPQGTVDAIVEAAHLITSLQTIVSRNKSPLEDGVVTCGTIQGGYNYNIIADKVNITGTCRSFTKDTQELIKSKMSRICCGVAQTFDGEIDLDYQYGYPPTINAYPECVEIVQSAAAKIVGVERSKKPQKTMGAEDFSYFLEEKPGCFFFVGAKLPGEIRPHHKSVFDFDEDAILVGASVLVNVARDVLNA